MSTAAGTTPGSHSEARPSAKAAEPAPGSGGAGRVVALDAVRGLALTILILVNNAGIRSAMPYQLSHPDWHGFTFADHFFPVFLFSMGAAMEFSRKAAHLPSVLRRVAMLFAIGVGLYSLRAGELVVGPGILQKIAVAYLLAWLVMRLPRSAHLAAALGLIALMWAGFLLAPLAGAVPGSWQPGTNFAAALDTILIGRPHSEGPASAIIATANVVGGALVIRTLRGLEARVALVRILAWGLGAVAIGLLLSPLVPVNKRMWTPSYTILSHGVACLYLAVYWWVADVRGWRGLVKPFTALGRNPILIFALFTALHTVSAPVRGAVVRPVAAAVGPTASSLLWSGTLTIVGIALALWLDRRRIYVRV